MRSFHCTTLTTISLVLFSLTACTKQSSSTSAGEALPPVTIDTQSARETNFNLSFTHPPAWGTWSRTEIPSQPQTDALAEMSFSELDRAIQAPQTGKADVNFTFRRYNEETYRFEEVCDFERSIDLCDVMKQQDLLEEKANFLKSTTHTIGGVPATLRDFYDPPSGYVAREARFYTPTHRVQITMIYDIGDFLMQQGPDDSSLFDTAQRILDQEISDPIKRLSSKYPNELKDMTAFYTDTELFLKSMIVRE